MIDAGRALSLVLFAAFTLGTAFNASADAPSSLIPKDLLLVGLQQGEWRLFVGDGERGLTHVHTESEPRTPAYSVERNRIAYISDRGAIREIALVTGKDTILLEPKPTQAYTQLSYRPGTDELYVVVLRQGSSVDTDLARIDPSKRAATTVSRQRSAQFEPTFTADGKHLIYSSVSCASECPKIIQELWSMDVVSATPQQLTMLNSISRQAVTDAKGRIIFSSNRDGHYQLWRLDGGDAQPQRLTSEPVVDESPAVSASGEVFFIRRTATGTRLMRLEDSGKVSSVQIDPAITDIRDLRSGASQ